MKRVEDVMSNRVLVAWEDTPYKEVVAAMQERGVTGVPVVDHGGHIIGVVSESDLMLKELPHPHHRLAFGRRRREQRKAEALNAGDLMSVPPVTIRPRATIVEAARLMAEHNIKRLPVTDERGKVVGIVTRRDLLKVFLRSDEDIRAEIADVLIPHKMWLSPEEGNVDVSVDHGVVHLRGVIERKTVADTLVSMIERVDGVVGVESLVGIRTDDTHIRPEIAPPFGVLPSSLRRP